jgi:pyruvate/2-oxoglutarate/acetoin dehydrogenase E1 component
VFENTQLGMSTGLALGGDLPVSVYPRINFLLCAMDALVLHLDALPIYSHDGYQPRVIIRTAIANPVPLDPGAQHLDPGTYVDALRSLLRTVTVVTLDSPGAVLPAYRAALERPLSTILVERAALYNEAE